MNAEARYHSPLREAQTAATRARIVDACVALMRSGADLTFAAVAKAAQIQERTVYRHFATKADLELAVWDWINANLTGFDFRPASEDELVRAMRDSFAGFDAGAGLIQAMLHSRQGLQIRLRQQPARRAMFEAVVATTVPGLPAAERAQAAAALQVLYSAASWELLRIFWGMDAAAAANTVELAIRSLLVGLRVGVGSERDRSSPAHEA